GNPSEAKVIAGFVIVFYVISKKDMITDFMNSGVGIGSLYTCFNILNILPGSPFIPRNSDCERGTFGFKITRSGFAVVVPGHNEITGAFKPFQGSRRDGRGNNTFFCQTPGNALVSGIRGKLDAVVGTDI